MGEAGVERTQFETSATPIPVVLAEPESRGLDSNPPESGRGIRVWLAFILLSAIWGSSYLFIRVGVRHLTPLSLVFGRLFVGFVVIGIIVAARRISVAVSSRTLVLLLVQGTINTALPFFLISAGEVKVPSGLAAVLNGTVPIFTMLLAGATLADERLSLRKVGGAVIGFAGVVVLVSHNPLHTGGSGVLVGELAILLSSVSYACGAVFARRALRGLPSMTVAFWAVLLAAAETGVLMLALSRPTLSGIDGLTIFAVLWLGVLGSGVAYVLAYFILKAWGASRATLVAYLMPLVGLLLGVVFLGETFDWKIAVGALLILAGVTFVNIKSLRLPTKVVPGKTSAR